MCPTSAASQAPRKAVLKSRDWLRGSYAGSHSAVLEMDSAFWAFATWQICTSPVVLELVGVDSYLRASMLSVDGHGGLSA